MGILNAQVPQLAKRFAFISWSIWYKRNAARLDSPSLPYSKIHANAIERLREFQQAQDLPSYSMSPLLWSTAGLGVVIRDHEGKVIGALSERIALPPSVDDVEALACRRAISFARKIGLQARKYT
uniref:RNase H type-1 domain-containing protein n=1 Tax=Quercus lobata TaxID=97700 RepID=A0A7N2LEQ1_QUELO